MSLLNLLMIPFILFMYTMLFGVLVLPLFVLGFKRITTATNNTEKTIGKVALFSPLAGLIVYVFVDYFEKINLSWVWFLAMLTVLVIPLVTVFASLVKKSPKKIKKSPVKSSKNKPAKTKKKS